jgi:tetratricopeptide (TPR) repeat protein
MGKIGRNNLCPCGSGNKYKRCCMAKDEAAARERLAAANAAAMAQETYEHSGLCDYCSNELDDAANAVFALIDAQKFDEAEQGAYAVIERFPDMHDGYECLGRLHQVKGDHRQAVECYRRVIEFAHNQPPFYDDPHFVEHFQNLIDQLEPQAAAAAG